MSAEEKRRRGREDSRRWRERNVEKYREQRRVRNERNRERIAAYNRSWRAKHFERQSQLSRDWKAANRDRVLDHGMAYTARQLGAYVAPVHRAEILERDLGLCGICGDAVDPASYHVDHVIPMTKGGTHEPDNVQVAHPLCNLSKGATVPDR